MWIHESFTNYSENLYTEYYHGKEAGAAYVIGCRKLIRNDKAIIGTYNVNRSGSGDMYYKGGNMLHTIRQIVNDDEKWRSILRGLNATFYHQTVTTQQIEDYMSQQAGINLSKVFDQYLRNSPIPVFEYRIKGKKLNYRWVNCVDGFDMTVKGKVKSEGRDTRAVEVLYPTTHWKSMKVQKGASVEIDPNFYVEVRKSK